MTWGEPATGFNAKSYAYNFIPAKCKHTMVIVLAKACIISVWDFIFLLQ